MMMSKRNTSSQIMLSNNKSTNATTSSVDTSLTTNAIPENQCSKRKKSLAAICDDLRNSPKAGNGVNSTADHDESSLKKQKMVDDGLDKDKRPVRGLKGNGSSLQHHIDLHIPPQSSRTLRSTTKTANMEHTKNNVGVQSPKESFISCDIRRSRDQNSTKYQDNNQQVHTISSIATPKQANVVNSISCVTKTRSRKLDGDKSLIIDDNERGTITDDVDSDGCRLFESKLTEKSIATNKRKISKSEEFCSQSEKCSQSSKNDSNSENSNSEIEKQYTESTKPEKISISTNTYKNVKFTKMSPIVASVDKPIPNKKKSAEKGSQSFENTKSTDGESVNTISNKSNFQNIEPVVGKRKIIVIKSPDKGLNAKSKIDNTESKINVKSAILKRKIIVIKNTDKSSNDGSELDNAESKQDLIKSTIEKEKIIVIKPTDKPLNNRSEIVNAEFAQDLIKSTTEKRKLIGIKTGNKITRQEIINKTDKLNKSTIDSNAETEPIIAYKNSKQEIIYVKPGEKITDQEIISKTTNNKSVCDNTKSKPNVASKISKQKVIYVKSDDKKTDQEIVNNKAKSAIDNTKSKSHIASKVTKPKIIYVKHDEKIVRKRNKPKSKPNQITKQEVIYVYPDGKQNAKIVDKTKTADIDNFTKSKQNNIEPEIAKRKIFHTKTDAKKTSQQIVNKTTKKAEINRKSKTNIAAKIAKPKINAIKSDEKIVKKTNKTVEIDNNAKSKTNIAAKVAKPKIIYAKHDEKIVKETNKIVEIDNNAKSKPNIAAKIAKPKINAIKSDEKIVEKTNKKLDIDDNAKSKPNIASKIAKPKIIDIKPDEKIVKETNKTVEIDNNAKSKPNIASKISKPKINHIKLDEKIVKKRNKKVDIDDNAKSKPNKIIKQDVIYVYPNESEQTGQQILDKTNNTLDIDKSKQNIIISDITKHKIILTKTEKKITNTKSEIGTNEKSERDIGSEIAKRKIFFIKNGEKITAYKCDCCEFRSNDVNKFQHHFLSHLDVRGVNLNKALKLVECKMRAVNQNYDKIRKCLCEKCKRTSESENKIQKLNTEDIKMNAMFLVCDMCGTTFDCLIELDKHVIEHVNVLENALKTDHEKNSENFSRKVNKKDDYLVAYLCNKCGSCFSTDVELNQHLCQPQLVKHSQRKQSVETGSGTVNFQKKMSDSVNSKNSDCSTNLNLNAVSSDDNCRSLTENVFTKNQSEIKTTDSENNQPLTKHLEQKIFKCEKCDHSTTSYIQSYVHNILTHTDSTCPNIVIRKCKICGFLCDNIRLARNHFSENHGSFRTEDNKCIYACNVCGFSQCGLNKWHEHCRTHIMLFKISRKVECAVNEQKTNPDIDVKQEQHTKATEIKNTQIERKNKCKRKTTDNKNPKEAKISKVSAKQNTKTTANNKNTPHGNKKSQQIPPNYKQNHRKVNSNAKSNLTNTKNFTDRSVYVCVHCNSRFPTIERLNTHSIIHNHHATTSTINIKDLHCSITNNNFQEGASSSKNISGHRNDQISTPHTSKKESAFECMQCRITFESVEDMQAHVDQHSNKTDFQCAKCSYLCADFTDMQRHVQVHLDD